MLVTFNVPSTAFKNSLKKENGAFVNAHVSETKFGIRVKFGEPSHSGINFKKLRKIVINQYKQLK